MSEQIIGTPAYGEFLLGRGSVQIYTTGNPRRARTLSGTMGQIGERL
jgi:hypothetical protein